MLMLDKIEKGCCKIQGRIFSIRSYSSPYYAFFMDKKDLEDILHCCIIALKRLDK